MAGQQTSPSIAALRKLEASVQWDLLEREALPRGEAGRSAHPTVAELGLTSWRLTALRAWVRWRRWILAAGALAMLAMVAVIGLWWRLANGPIDFDVATPWLTAAIEENFGNQHRVAVGGAQIERDASGRTALRIRDIVVRDAHGAVVASAPKAEVGVSGAELFTGRVRANRLSLVGAEMQVRIEPDSKVTVFAGSNRQFSTASAVQTPLRAGIASSPPILERAPAAQANARSVVPDFGALLAWIDGLGASGLDGHDLSELGLKNGVLTVDDQRNGKTWTFEDINLSLTRPRSGGIALTVSSEAGERPWLLRATMTRGEKGNRIVEIESDKLPAKDLMLALRIGDGKLQPDIPVSARIRAELGPDGMPVGIAGRIFLDKGAIVDTDDPLTRIAIDRAEFTLDWDAERHAMVVPFQMLSGGNRITLLAQIEPPRETGGNWMVRLTGGTVLLALSPTDPTPVVLNRFLLRLRVDPGKQRVDVEQGDIGNLELGLAISGALDYSEGEPRLMLGIAGTRMSVGAMKRLWPGFVSSKVRAWVEDHVVNGTVEKILIATNAPMATLKRIGPPIPDDGLAIEITGHGAEFRPVDGLPSIRDVADVKLQVTGRTATVTVGRGNIELSNGRRLAFAGGAFEVPDTYVDAPPARVRFRLDGPVAGAAELLNMPRLREFAESPVEPSGSRGTMAAHVALGLLLKEDLPPGSAQYAINLELANFAAEKLVMGHKVEAASLRARADNKGYSIRGDVRINGIPAFLDYRKGRTEPEAEVRVASTLDESARRKLGLDLNGQLVGPVSVKINGRVPPDGGTSRYSVEADLTQARIDKLIPGWIKPAGGASRASFILTSSPGAMRFDDVLIEGSGASIKGSLELDRGGDVVAANFPAFHLSDGDRASLKAERGSDGALRITVRGDVYDGRGFVKSSMAGPTAKQAKNEKPKDIDLDVRFGTVAGFHGETVRGVDMKLSRRNGNIMSFSLSGRLGRDAMIVGDLRGRPGGRSVIFVEAKDAGAFFRFSDTYPRIFGGEMWVAMDPPSGGLTPQDGILNIRDFSVRGEAALDRVVAGNAEMPGSRQNSPGVEFSRLRVEFTRSLGRFSLREAMVRGPAIGATAEGYIDYNREEVRMRGTFVPFFGLNNMFGQIPVFGLFLGGGSNEGLVGLTFEVVGPPGAPVLRVNPISVVAPGLMRKFFEFPTGATPPRPQSFVDPGR